MPSHAATEADRREPVREPKRAREQDWLAGHRWNRSDWLVAVALAVVGTLVAVVWRTEIVPTDPWHYTRAALAFPSSSWVPLGYTRYGMILPAGPLVLLFGNAQVTYYFWAVVSAGVLAGSVYLLGRRWWGVIGGVLAVVLTLSNTIVFLNLSRGYPDVESTALFCLALVFALLARDRLVHHERFPLVVLLLVGFLLGWGFEARETSLLGWPVVALVLWRRESLLKVVGVVLAPLVVWAGVDVAIGAFAYGDPLLKLHTFSGQDLSTATNPADLAAQRELVGRPRLHYLTVIPKAMASGWTTTGVIMLVLCGAAVVAAVAGRRATRLMGLWFLCVFILFVGIGGLFFPSHPSGRLDVTRYWIPFFPPAALAVTGLVCGLALTLGRSLTRSWGPTAVAVVAAVAVAAVPVVTVARFAGTPVFAPNGATALQDLRGFMAAKKVKDATVWSDWETVRLLPIYQRGAFGGEPLWTAKFKSLTSKGAPKSGDYVVLYSVDGRTCSFCASALKPWRTKNPSPPSSWTREYSTSTGNLAVYRVG